MTPYIRYIFKLQENRIECFNIKFDEYPVCITESSGIEKTPDWYRLDFKQCPNCTLSLKEHLLCPMMSAIGPAASRFGNIVSYENVDLEVISEERTVIQKTSVQRALSSLIGILIALSGCPHTVYFRPMARFHLPLSTEDETVFRAAGMYLIAQYLRKTENLDAELGLSGLVKIYENMKTVNIAVTGRLREATKADSMVNAVILLDLFAKALPVIIEMKLEELKPVFSPYLS